MVTSECVCAFFRAVEVEPVTAEVMQLLHSFGAWEVEGLAHISEHPPP